MSLPPPMGFPEAVRHRPGMYIGGTDERALHSCAIEVIANAIHEHLAGRGSLITITIHDDASLSVKDEGGGISVATHPEHKLSLLESALTIQSVRRPYPQSPHFTTGADGVGVKFVNAVSEWMRVNTVCDGREYQIAFARGYISEPLTKLAESTTKRGTTVRFKPDPQIFRTLIFDRRFLDAQLDHLAVLHPNLAFCLVDERPNVADRPLVSLFLYRNGIADFLKIHCSEKSRRHLEPILLNHDAPSIKISLGIQFIYNDNAFLFSFVNSSRTPEGGTHVSGFLRGLADAFNELAPSPQPFQPKDIRPSLCAFIAVWLEDPKYSGAMKDKLYNPEVEAIVHDLTSAGIKRWAATSADDAQWLIESLNAARNGQSDR